MKFIHTANALPAIDHYLLEKKEIEMKEKQR